MRVADPCDLLIGGCGCGRPWYERRECGECLARDAAHMAFSQLAHIAVPECLNIELAEGGYGDAGRQIPPHKLAIIRRAIDLMSAAFEQARHARPSGPIGVVT